MFIDIGTSIRYTIQTYNYSAYFSSTCAKIEMIEERLAWSM